MKNKLKQIMVFFLSVLLISSLCLACSDSDEKDLNLEEKENEEPNPEYKFPFDIGSSLLVGTKWKLQGYVNPKTGEIQHPASEIRKSIPDYNEGFTLYFADVIGLNGKASANQYFSYYSLDSINNKVQIDRVMLTEMYVISIVDGDTIDLTGEDESRYAHVLSTVHSYALSEDELKLFYDENLYMLFNRTED